MMDNGIHITTKAARKVAIAITSNTNKTTRQLTTKDESDSDDDSSVPL